MLRILLTALLLIASTIASAADSRPNIFVAMADDWGWPHAGACGDPVVRTPTFDRLAKEGVLFANAFVSSPSCTPSRGALLTGQYHWRLEENANLWSTLQTKFRTYPEILRDAGYATGHSRKAWGPGRLDIGGRKEDPTGPAFRNFGEFLKQRPEGKPFCYWFGSSDPHRPYVAGTGQESGLDLSKIHVPGCFPDNETIRSDIADYYFEVERFDREVGEALAQLKAAGELDNTIIVMTGDHGMPFPRGKSNLYDLGTRVPLVIRWPRQFVPGTLVEDFISTTDLAPTFLWAAGSQIPAVMTGRSLMAQLTPMQAGQEDPSRDHVIFGKERHVPSQERGNTAGYPSRAIRTRDFLYIRNFRPELWPNGIADGKASEKGNAFADCDDGPTKTFLVTHRDDPGIKPFFDLAFAKRPAEELYDLRSDPEQLKNIAADPEFRAQRERLWQQLESELKASQDPRVIGGAEKFDTYPYLGGRAGEAPDRKKKS